MVAIGVFGIGILGVVALMTSNISALHRAKVQSTASMLVQNGMELLFHHKTTNQLRQLPRDCITYAWNGENKRECIQSFATLVEYDKALVLDRGDTDVCYKTFDPSDSDGVRKESKMSLIETDLSLGEEKHITRYLHTGKLYQYDEDSENGKQDCQQSSLDDSQNKKIVDTPFARYITFTGVKHLPENRIFSGRLYKAEVHGIYREGGLTGEILLETFIADTYSG